MTGCLQTFTHSEYGELRTVEIDGEPWMVGRDVAVALGYRDAFGALRRHVDDEDKTNFQDNTFETPRGMVVVNESGLYSLVLSSKLPSAKAFRRWVTSEVLPTIRKHGAYMSPEMLEQAILNPDTMIRLCMTLKDEREKRAELEAANALLEADNAALEADNQTMRPKADYYDELSNMNLLLNFRDTAKELKIKEKAFIQLLIDRKYIYRNISGKLCPFAKYVPDLFEVKERVNSQTNWCGTQTLITPKGRDTFRRLCKSLQPAA